MFTKRFSLLFLWMECYIFIFPKERQINRIFIFEWTIPLMWGIIYVDVAGYVTHLSLILKGRGLLILWKQQLTVQIDTYSVFSYSKECLLFLPIHVQQRLDVYLTTYLRMRALNVFASCFIQLKRAVETLTVWVCGSEKGKRQRGGCNGGKQKTTVRKQGEKISIKIASFHVCCFSWVSLHISMHYSAHLGWYVRSETQVPP